MHFLELLMPLKFCCCCKCSRVYVDLGLLFLLARFKLSCLKLEFCVCVCVLSWNSPPLSVGCVDVLAVSDAFIFNFLSLAPDSRCFHPTREQSIHGPTMITLFREPRQAHDIPRSQLALLEAS